VILEDIWNAKVKRKNLLGTLKLIRENKVGESTSPAKRPFKNLLLKVAAVLH